MYSKSTFAAATAFLLPLASAQLDGSTVMDPAMPYDQIDSNILDSLPPATHSIAYWADQPDRSDLIPQDIKDQVEGEEGGLLATDTEVFEVKYDDCDTPWIMGRHKEATSSAEDMANMFGRLPVRARQYIRHLTSVPGAASAASNNNNIVFRDDTNKFSIYAHETGHSLDSTAFDAYPSGFSPSDVWTDAYNADNKVVASDYSRSSQAENLAQMIVIALFDQNVPDGIQTIASNWQQVGNALAATNDNIGDQLKPGATCGARLEQSPAVSKGGAASRLMRFVKNSPMPDMSLAPGLKVIRAREFHFEDKF